MIQRGRSDGGLIVRILRSLDAFPKVDTSYLNKTSWGALASIATYCVMAVLVVSELYGWLQPPMVNHFSVDTRVHAQMPLSFDISVATACEKLVVLLFDDGGHAQVFSSPQIETTEIDFTNLINSNPQWKAQYLETQTRLAREAEARRIKEEKAAAAAKATASPKLNEMGAKKTREEEPTKEVESPPKSPPTPSEKVIGCRLKGDLSVPKTNGRFLIMPIMSLLTGNFATAIQKSEEGINFNHYIHHFSFGERDHGGLILNPLNNHTNLAMDSNQSCSYFLSILPTTYTHGATSLDTNQYSVTGYLGLHNDMRLDRPGVYFAFTLEPLSVRIQPEHRSSLELLIHLLGILGGVYTCSGILSRLIQTFWQKIQRTCFPDRKETAVPLNIHQHLPNVEDEFEAVV